MTETISHGIVGDPHVPSMPGAIGRAAPEYDVRIVDDDGQPTRPGDTGNLLIGGLPGTSLFKEYLHDAAATASAFDEFGFLKTGDRVQLNEDGSLRFADRAKNILRVGGENVAALEIERVAAAVPGVLEAAVIGRPHAMLDEVPVVFVIPRGGLEAATPALADGIIAACRRDLASFKVPTEVRFLDDFPRATLEKVVKTDLAKLL